ncbi:hypothetical protein DM860_015650 [Cuscuta australis]|uniref:BHLH domain-containing protein n=1 Tax=Cuscuta australis TaxID=267555 RepID=A0A328DGC0_9ASTE|nr:hypothetical protein DM860_015650 [Cuscuta australis]
MSQHIAVERKRRRQMNEHLKILRSLTPSFYIKRGDQASIIGGVVEFIKELHLIQQSLEAKKRMKRLNTSHAKAPLHPNSIPETPCLNAYNSFKEVEACCNSPVANVEAMIFGTNVILKTISRRIPGQIVRIMTVLDRLFLEILHLNISSMEDTVLYTFVVKIGLECHVSVDELASEVQLSFRSEEAYKEN